MKLSLCSANYGNTNLDTIIQRTADLGFDGIELTVMFHVPPATDATTRRKVRSWLEEAALPCSALHYIFGKDIRLASTDRKDNRRAIEHLRSVIDLATDLGAPTIIVGGGSCRSIRNSQKQLEIEKAMVDAFSTAGDYALGKHVVLAMEALNRYETNYINTLKEASDFAARVGLPSIRIMGDTFHMNIEEQSIEDAIRTHARELAHLHLADSNRLAPGQGHVDFAPVVNAVEESGFSGYCSFEVFCIKPDLMYLEPFESADLQMKDGMKYIKSLLDV
jgi:sugar phosphate isomerase/epimerase